MRWKSSILRSSGVVKGAVSVRKAFRLPSFSNRMVQPRVRSHLGILGAGKQIAGKRYGLRTGNVKR